MINIKNKKILVTGGTGFLGSAICKNIEDKGGIAIPLKSEEVNLLNLESIIQFMAASKPDYCIHAAGYNGGIEFNRMYPADILHSNTIMGLNLHYACQYMNVKKVLSIMTSCAYPDTGMEFLKEETFWEGLPNKTIRAHGIAKRTLQTAAESYNEQYELNAVTVCVTNLYGPKDTFNLVRTKVVGALIRKFVEAVNENGSVDCWGTGAPMREFMYVDDAAEAIVQALQKYEDPSQPLNIGTGKDISIKQLVEYIVEATGFSGEVNWDTDKPDGQMKKLLDNTRMSSYIKISPIEVKEGIKKTVKWYRGNKEYADSRK
jgi:nucleoside-diphosphate-sugar epimerase|tara:strand:+ start:450 stop:1400 length:951 start_codon:yes stop_codon:yes gene_type:complete